MEKSGEGDRETEKEVETQTVGEGILVKREKGRDRASEKVRKEQEISYERYRQKA